MKKKKFLAAVLCALLLAVSFSAAEQIKSCYPALGLRWKEPLSQTQAEALRTVAGEQEDAPLYPTFWREEQGQAHTELHQADEVTAIRFNGEESLCYPARFISGGYPGSEDTSGCATSTALAWQLFGSNDVVGQSLEWEGISLTVRGVFEENERVLLRGCSLADTFSAVELSGSFEDDRKAQAQELIRQAGLPLTDSMVYGQSMGTAATGLCFLPLLLAGVLLISECVRRMRNLPPVHRQVLLFGIGTGLALCLPFLLEQLPGWMIPAQWSDFSFWPQLGETLLACLNEWFAVFPCRKDVLAKQALTILAVCSAAASMLTVELYNRTRA